MLAIPATIRRKKSHRWRTRWLSRRSQTHNRPLKTRLVTKLRGARERIRETQGNVRAQVLRRAPPGIELVVAAKRLHRRSRKGHRRSLREIARELQGHAVLGILRQVDDRGAVALSARRWNWTRN